MRRTLLLTGASGFVGRQVLRALQASGESIRVVTRSPDAFSWPADTTLVRSDNAFAESATWWADAARGVDAVLHMAWYAEPGAYLQSPLNLDCLRGTLTMAEGCAAAGVRRFVGVGTCFEYDTREGYLSTRTPLNPASPYAAAKAAAYLFLREYLAERKVSFAWCRLFHLFGEGEDPRRLIPYVRNQLAEGRSVELTSGQQIRDYLDVRQAGAELARQLLGSREGSINICSGEGRSVRQIVECIADEYGRRDLLSFGVRADNFTDPPVVVGIKD
jgi:dTDP-6-deoxy-L-talose 4-dehydrogenase (NAD+)